MDAATEASGQRFDGWLVHTFVIGPPHRMPPAPGPVPDEPTARPIPLPVRVAIHAFAAAIPVAAAALLIPLRDNIAPSTAALILVLPVDLIALTGSATAGALSAIAAAVAFDVFHTRPYYSLTIDTADDVESALVLGLIALIVATVVTREIESRTRSSSRRRELAAVDAVAHAAAHADPNRLIQIVTGAIADLLDARTCYWSPGFHGTIGPVLNRTGTSPAQQARRWPAQRHDARSETHVAACALARCWQDRQRCRAKLRRHPDAIDTGYRRACHRGAVGASSCGCGRWLGARHRRVQHEVGKVLWETLASSR